MQPDTITIPVSEYNQLLLAAKRSKELEQKLTDWSNKELLGETDRCQFEAMKVRLKEVEKERDELNRMWDKQTAELMLTTAQKNELQTLCTNVTQQLSTLRTAYKQALEAIEHKDILLKVYLRRAESLLSSDDRSASYDEIRLLRHAIAQPPLAIETRKVNRESI